MMKLMILIEALYDQKRFEEFWPQFLRLAEAMPGLRRETTSWMHGKIAGGISPAMIHELYFDDRAMLDSALRSAQGVAAGRMLQWITDGRVTLLFADHQEDELEHILASRKPPTGEEEDHNG